MKRQLHLLWISMSAWCAHRLWKWFVRPHLACPRCGCRVPDPEWPNCWHCARCGNEWCVWTFDPHDADWCIWDELRKW